jgi:hypothetical protein
MIVRLQATMVLAKEYMVVSSGSSANQRLL